MIFMFFLPRNLLAKWDLGVVILIQFLETFAKITEKRNQQGGKKQKDASSSILTLKRSSVDYCTLTEISASFSA
jgi:hypothetical protein